MKMLYMMTSEGNSSTVLFRKQCNCGFVLVVSL